MNLTIGPEEIICPRCGKSVDISTRQCSNCGIDLALAVLFTEKNISLPHNSEFLFQLPTHNSKEFYKDKPSSKHYWEWGSEERE